jgi:hypothetical protein
MTGSDNDSMSNTFHLNLLPFPTIRSLVLQVAEQIYTGETF